MPEIFDGETMARLLMADDPKRLLVDELNVSPEMAEVFLRGLATHRRFTHNLQYAALRALMDRNAPRDAHAKAYRIAETIVHGEFPDQWNVFTWGLALYRAGRFEEALTVFNRAENGSAFLADIDKDPGLYTDIRAALALTHARLGHVREARDWIDKARFMDRRKEIETGGGERHALLDEAEERMLDLDFPPNPFSP